MINLKGRMNCEKKMTVATDGGRKQCRHSAWILPAVLGVSGVAPFSQALMAQALEEVLVTASRRETSVQDLPYNITAYSMQTLKESRVTTLTDLSQTIAGVAFTDAGPTSRSDIILRGINSNATDQPSSLAVAPVSMYVGETPVFLPIQINDIARVEVLRGPQGTLYGSGSLAGLVRFIPNEPDPSAFSAEITAELGSVEEASDLDAGAFGVINVPLSDRSALRFSGGYQRFAGFIDENFIVDTGDPSSAINSPVGIPISADPSDPLLGPLSFLPEDDVNEVDMWHIRGSLLLEPSDRARVLLSYHHQEEETRGVQAHSPDFVGNVDTPPEDNPFWSPEFPVSFPTGGVVFPQNEDYEANNSFLLSEERNFDLFTADVTYDLGFASLFSTTSYYEDQSDGVGDNTGLLTLFPDFYGFIPRMVDFQTTSEKSEGFVQEFRLVSNGGERFDYVAGLFYQEIDVEEGQFQWIPGQTFYGGLVGFAGGNAEELGDLNVIGDDKTRFEDKAAFGELTWHVTDSWQVTGGIRVFDQEFDLVSNLAFPFCGSFCDNTGGTLGNTFVESSSTVNDEILKLNSSYAISDSLNVYATYAEGFRRGGSSGLPISGPFAGNPDLLTYQPDETKNYEIGVKGVVAGQTFSIAAFFIEWDDFQVEDSAASSGAGVVVNGDSAESRGLEVQLDGSLDMGLRYRLGYAYADSEVANDFSVIDLENSPDGPVPVAIIEANKGDPLPNAPDHSLTLGLDYEHTAPVLEGWQMRWHLNASYRSSALSQLISANPADPLPFKIDSFTMIDASINLAKAGEGLSFSLFVDNLTNELAMTGGSDRGNVGLRAEQFFVGRPRVVGLQLRYSFGG